MDPVEGAVDAAPDTEGFLTAAGVPAGCVRAAGLCFRAASGSASLVLLTP